MLTHPSIRFLTSGASCLTSPLRKPFRRQFSDSVRQFQKRAPIVLSLDWTRPKDPPLSLGHASIIANLNKREVPHIHQAWAVNCPTFHVDQVVDFIMTQQISSSGAADIAVGAYVWNERYVQDIISKLRQYKFMGNIIVGGPQVSYVKDNDTLEAIYDADVFIRGTAEDALANLYQSEHTPPGEPQRIHGVHYRGVPDLAKSTSASLETIASPLLSGIIRPQTFIRWETQRGCAFNCSFCQHKEPDKAVLKNNRYFSKSRVDAEIDWIVANPVVQDIAILDPVFNSGPNYLNILQQLRAGRYQGRIWLQCKADMANNEFLDELTRLKDQGAHPVLEFGLQTANKDEMRLINRSNNLNKVTRILEECAARGLDHEVSLIFGLPNQTVSSFQESVAFITQPQFDIPTIHAFPLMLLRGTDLYEQKQKYGLIESNEVISKAIDRVQHDIPHVISSHTFTRDDYHQMKEIAESLEKRNKVKKDIYPSPRRDTDNPNHMRIPASDSLQDFFC
jgi:radical SAM superfamily enzyme YgiQ (UPF0313 family)